MVLESRTIFFANRGKEGVGCTETATPAVCSHPVQSHGPVVASQVKGQMTSSLMR